MLTLELEFVQIGDPIWNQATVSHPIRISQFHYGKVCTHASCKTARIWESFDHQGLEYPPYKRITVQV